MSVSLLTYSPILQIKRLHLTHYSPIISLLPTVLLCSALPAVRSLNNSSPISSRCPQVLSSPGSHPLNDSSTNCPVQSLRDPPYLLPTPPVGSLHRGSPWPSSEFVHLGTLHMLFPTPALLFPCVFANLEAPLPLGLRLIATSLERPCMTS